MAGERKRAMPLGVKRAEKLLQIITPHLHLRLEASLGSGREGYVRPGVSLTTNASGSRGWTVEVESRDYLILKMVEQIPKSFERGERGRASVITVCLTQPLLPSVVRILHKMIKHCRNDNVFWLQEDREGFDIWKSDTRDLEIKVKGTKGNRKLSVFPHLIEVELGSNTYAPGVCLKGTDSVKNRQVTVLLTPHEAQQLADYLARLDLTALGMQLIQLAMLASREMPPEGGSDLTENLREKVGKLTMVTKKDIMAMDEGQVESLMMRHGIDNDFVPESPDHLKECVVETMRSLGKLSEEDGNER